MDIERLEFGIDTFGDVTAGPDGALLPHDQVIRNLIDEAVLADEVGLDAIGLGEHHRDDFAVSAPDMVLAGIATRTTRLKLATAVTVLSSDDPVRVFERFSTLDALSNGRAELIAGRGSFIESFPLFGYDLADYEALFEEKLAMLAQLIHGGRQSWTGRSRRASTTWNSSPAWPRHRSPRGWPSEAARSRCCGPRTTACP